MPVPTRGQLVQATAALWLPTLLRAADELIIGQNITLQGGKNACGSDMLAGVRVLFDAANREGGVNGRRLALRTLDDDNRTDQAEANARRLVAEGALLLFGSIEGGPPAAR